MYLGVSGPSVSPGLIQVKSTHLAGRKRPQTRQATAAAKKKRQERTHAKTAKKKAAPKKKKPKKKTTKKKATPKKKKTSKPKKKAKKQKVGLVIKNGKVIHRPAIGKVKRLTYLQLIRKLPAKIILQYIKKA